MLLPDAPRYTIVAVSDAYLRATMTSRDAILGRGLFEVFPDPPDDPDATGTRNLRASLERAVSSKAADTMAVQHYDIRRPDGSWEERHWSPINTPVCDASGAITHIIHRVEDVTDVVLLARRERERAQEVEAAEQRTIEMQHELVRRAQELDAANRSLREANARVTEMLAERERLLAAERAARVAIEETDRAKTAFFSNVSHEFRTPLTLMIGPIEQALAAPDKALPHNDLDLIRRNALRLLKLVNTLLDFARIEAGRVEMAYEPLDLAAYTAELASSFRSIVEGAGLRFTVDAPPLPRPVYVDRGMWEKIVLNLISNAFKHTFDGEIEVSVRQHGGYAELSVRDTGVGIAPAHLPHLFTRFHRVSNTRARTQEGSGIGLALVQDLVKLHGGELDVQSKEGVGTTFSVFIPFGAALPYQAPAPTQTSAAGVTPYVDEARHWLAPSSVNADTADVAIGAAAPSPAWREARGAKGRGRVLVVDDNADMRDYMARLLRESGLSVETAPDGDAALKAARAQPPDLVLSDVMMPGLSGFDLLRELRSDPATAAVPFILVSARAGEQSTVEGLEAGADDYLVKPFLARELVARVRVNLELARMRRELARSETANAAKSEFLATMSHELRTPLNATLGYLQLMELGLRGPLSETQHDALARIRRSQEHLLAMITEILEFSRLEASPSLAELEAVPVGTLFDAVRELIEPQVKTKSLTFDCVDRVPDVRVRANGRQAKRVVLNLLTNAVKYTPEGGRVGVACVPGEETVAITVTDNGIGIPADKLHVIFEPFVQLGRTLSSTQDGIGLGLAISRNIARAMGGDITAESEPGKGSKFTLTLLRA